MKKQWNECDTCRYCQNPTKVPADAGNDDEIKPYAFDVKFYCEAKRATLYRLPQTLFRCAQYDAK